MTHLAPIEGRAGATFGAGRRKPAVTERRHLGEIPTAYLLLAPVIILFAFAVVYPVIDTIRLSFYDIKGLYPPRLHGAQQFRHTLQRRHFPPGGGDDADLDGLHDDYFGFGRLDHRASVFVGAPSRRSFRAS